MRFGVLAIGALALLSSSCRVNREIHLWPIVDLEREPVAVPDGTSEPAREGIELSLFWPLGRLDTTGTAPKHYFFPLYSYNAEKHRGTFLSGIIRYRHDEKPSFTVLPFYWWGRKSDDHSWHHLFPLVGHSRDGDVSTTYVGPYIDSRSPTNWVRGLMVPPVLFSSTNDPEKDDGWFWVLNVFHSRNSGRRTTAVLPLYIGSDSESDDSSQHWSYLFPTIYWRNRDANGERVESDLVAWPLVESHRDRKGNAFDLLRVPTLSFDGLGLTSIYGRERTAEDETRRLELFPFYTAGNDRGSHTRSIPLLGISWWENWDERRSLFSSDWRTEEASTGWAAWPFVAHSTSAATNDGEERAVHTRALAGLYRHDRDPGSSWRLALLFPFQEISESSVGNRAAHRLWPLYRYERHDHARSFVALGEFLGLRHGTELDEDPFFWLHPVSYQSTGDGDHDFRVLWKWIESRRDGDRRRWAIHPLVYRRSSPDAERLLFLGGLLGLGREENRSFVRVLWLFDLGR
ncbi:MAG: hypothetical protein KDC38_02510 [Planctomycetes bacterium]|nr:hypothetical protein [Planctomycetota bacterium]